MEPDASQQHEETQMKYAANEDRVDVGLPSPCSQLPLSPKAPDQGGTVEVEEEFAYGNSIGYLRHKGYSDDEIIDKNFMPHLIQTVDNKKILYKIINLNNISMHDFLVFNKNKKLLEKEKKQLINKIEKDFFYSVCEEARERGYAIISLFDRKNKNIESKKDNKALKYIDLD